MLPHDLLVDQSKQRARQVASNARPSVTIHCAQSLDGRIATRSGQSQWLGSCDSLVYAHSLRATHDAILVGIGTVLTDDPQLTTRLVPGPSPTRIVLDSTLRIPLGARVLAQPVTVPTIIVTTPRAATERIDRVRQAGATVVIVPSEKDNLVSINHTLDRLASLRIRSVLVEGGARTITSFLRAGSVSRMCVCVRPLVSGGFDLPAKYGYAVTGYVTDVGADVTDAKPGDHVFAFHPHQDAFLCPRELVVPLDRKVNLEQAAPLANSAPHTFVDRLPVLSDAQSDE